MQELDRPVAETVPATEECGGPMSMPPPMSSPSMNDQPPPAHPSMSVNLNAQGIENIKDLMDLIHKVNPDMAKPEMPPLPSLSMPPSITSIKPSLPPLKMLPDLDKDEPDHDEPDADNMGGPSDNDADNKIDIISKSMDMDDKDDMDDMGDKDDDEEKKKEGFQDATTSPDPEFKDTDYMVNKLAGGMNGPKKMFKHSYKQGDNPMAMEGEELRNWIKSELRHRLEEAKSK